VNPSLRKICGKPGSSCDRKPEDCTVPSPHDKKSGRPTGHSRPKKASEQHQFFRSPSGLPFSDAVMAGDTLYLSGRIGFDNETKQLFTVW